MLPHVRLLRLRYLRHVLDIARIAMLPRLRHTPYKCALSPRRYLSSVGMKDFTDDTPSSRNLNAMIPLEIMLPQSQAVINHHNLDINAYGFLIFLVGTLNRNVRWVTGILLAILVTCIHRGTPRAAAIKKLHFALYATKTPHGEAKADRNGITRRRVNTSESPPPFFLVNMILTSSF